MAQYHMTIPNDVIGILGATPEYYRGPHITVSGGAWALTTGDLLPANFDSGVEYARFTTQRDGVMSDQHLPHFPHTA